MTLAAQVLVTGASGFIGSHITQALCLAGYDVICCGRDTTRLKAQFPSCRVVEYDFTKPPTSDFPDSLLRGVSVVINASGIIQEHGANTFETVHRDGPIALFRAAERAGVRRIIQISALGSDTHATTRYHRTKQAADNVLKTLSVEWVILHPSLVYGTGGRSHAFFSALAALPILPLPGHGDQQVQPVHINDFVLGIVRLLQSTAPSHVTLAVVGPEPVTFRQFMEAIRKWLGMTAGPTLAVPMGLISLVARIGDIVRSEFVNTDTLSMLRRGNTADPTAFQRLTSVEIQSLSKGLPAAAGTSPDLIMARLYFLSPLLRLSIATVWIGSGVVALFFYPHDISEAWLRRTGIPSAWTGLTLTAASMLDIILGLAMLARWRMPLILASQLVLILGFTVILTARMPELWAHPFGPLLKNFPLCIATLVLWALERRP
ncbi:MAG: NAD(P)H-binding protein [Nitrospira sp.]|nr:NAD(P)H-binding protein [Nitrospira sp.]